MPQGLPTDSGVATPEQELAGRAMTPSVLPAPPDPGAQPTTAPAAPAPQGPQRDFSKNPVTVEESAMAANRVTGFGIVANYIRNQVEPNLATTADPSDRRYDLSFSPYKYNTPEFISSHPAMAGAFQDQGLMDGIGNENQFWHTVMRKDEERETDTKIDKLPYGASLPFIAADMLAGGALLKGASLAADARAPAEALIEGLGELGRMGAVRTVAKSALIGGATAVAFNHLANAVRVNGQSNLDLLTDADPYAMGLGVGLGAIAGGLHVNGGSRRAAQMRAGVLNALLETPALDTLKGVRDNNVSELQKMLAAPVTQNDAIMPLKTTETNPLIDQLQEKFKTAGYKLEVTDHPGQWRYDRLSGLENWADSMGKALKVNTTGPVGALATLAGSASPGSRLANAPGEFPLLLHRILSMESRPVGENINTPISYEAPTSAEVLRLQNSAHPLSIPTNIEDSVRDYFKGGGKPFSVTTPDGPETVNGRRQWRSVADAAELHRQNVEEQNLGGNPAPQVHPMVEDTRKMFADYYSKTGDAGEAVGLWKGRKAYAEQQIAVEDLQDKRADEQNPDRQAKIDEKLSAAKDTLAEMEKAEKLRDTRSSRRWLTDRVIESPNELKQAFLKQWNLNREVNFYDKQDRIDPNSRAIIPEAVKLIPESLRPLYEGAKTEGDIGQAAQTRAAAALEEAKRPVPPPKPAEAPAAVPEPSKTPLGDQQEAAYKAANGGVKLGKSEQAHVDMIRAVELAGGVAHEPGSELAAATPSTPDATGAAAAAPAKAGAGGEEAAANSASSGGPTSIDADAVLDKFKKDFSGDKWTRKTEDMLFSNTYTGEGVAKAMGSDNPDIAAVLRKVGILNKVDGGYELNRDLFQSRRLGEGEGAAGINSPRAKGAGKQLWEMHPDELAAAEAHAKNWEQDQLASALGDKAKEWDRLDRRANSATDPAAADRAQAQKESLEASLTPTQRAALEKFQTAEGPDVESIKSMKRSIQQLDPSSPEALGNSLRFAVTRIGEETDPLKMTATEREAYGQIRYANQLAAEHGYDIKEVGQQAIRASAARFKDPSDAEEMLSRWFEPSSAAGESPKQLAAPVVAAGEEAVRGVVDEKAVAAAQAEVDRLKSVADSGELLRHYHEAVGKAFDSSAEIAVRHLSDIGRYGGFHSAADSLSSPLAERMLNELDERNFSKWLDNDPLNKLNMHDHQVGGRIAIGQALQRSAGKLAPWIEQLTGEKFDPANPNLDQILRTKPKSEGGGYAGALAEYWKQRLADLEALDDGPRKTQLQGATKAIMLENLRDMSVMGERIQAGGPSSASAQGANWRRFGMAALRIPISSMLGLTGVNHLGQWAGQGMLYSAGESKSAAIISTVADAVRIMKDGTPKQIEGLVTALADDGRTTSDMFDMARQADRSRPEYTATGKIAKFADVSTNWLVQKEMKLSSVNWNMTLLKRTFSKVMVGTLIDGMVKMAEAEELRAGGVGEQEAIAKVGLHPADAQRLSRLGLNGQWSQKIIAELQEHGINARSGDPIGENLPTTPKDARAVAPEFAKWTDLEARDKFSTAIDQEVDAIASRPSNATRPIMNDTFLGKMFNMFWGYHTAWGNRTAFIAAQGTNGQQAQYFTHLMLSGALIDAAHNALSGRRSLVDTAQEWHDNPQAMAYAAFGRSGALGLLQRPVNIADRSPFGIGPQLGQTVSSQHTAQAIDLPSALLGPSMDYYDRLFQNAVIPAFQGKGYSARNAQALYMALPFRNLPQFTAPYAVNKELGGEAMPLQDIVAPNRGAAQ